MIRDANVKYDALQHTIITITVTLPADRTFADWDDFTLTIREDPKYLARGKRDLETADPHGEAWVIVSQTAGELNEAETALVFDLTMPAGPGTNRYSHDIRATGGAAGETVFYPSTWLSVDPATK